MSTDLVPVPVRGADAPLQAIQIDGRPFVALRPLCDSLGIDYASQHTKIKRKSWATVVLNTMVAGDGTSREMLLIDRRTMTMWLATLDENRVGEHAGDLVIAYQCEAADALDAYFNASARPTTIDGIRAMLDQIEAAQREASEAKEIATRTEARLDGIEARHDWFAAVGYARHVGIVDTSLPAMNRLGRRAAAIARDRGITPERVQHQHFGQVNLLPVSVWEAAAEQLGLQVAR
jgi:hypothetical protein